MIVQRTSDEVIVRLPASVDTDDLQDFLKYARYRELTSRFSVGQEEVDALAKQINTGWWAENRQRLTK